MIYYESSAPVEFLTVPSSSPVMGYPSQIKNNSKAVESYKNQINVVVYCMSYVTPSIRLISFAIINVFFRNYIYEIARSSTKE